MHRSGVQSYTLNQHRGTETTNRNMAVYRTTHIRVSNHGSAMHDHAVDDLNPALPYDPRLWKLW